MMKMIREDCYIKAINKWNERCDGGTQEMLQEANLEWLKQEVKEYETERIDW